jgi:hypothetical protein
MQIGAENRTKAIIAGVLAVLAIGSALRTFVFTGGPSTPATSAAAAPSTAQPARQVSRSVTRSGKSAVNTASSLDPRLRLDLLATSEGVQYSGAGRNIFNAEIAIEPAKANPNMAKQQPPVPAQPEVQPPPLITLKFFGFASKPGEPKRIFLSQDSDVFIAGEGDIVNRRYKIIRITPNAVEVEDMLYNNRQSLPLVQG